MGVAAGYYGPFIDALAAEGVTAAVIDYRSEDFAARGAEYDIVVECVGNAPYARSRAVLRPGGVLLLVIADLPGMIGAKLRPTRAGIRRIQDVGPITGPMLGELTRRMAGGELRPVLDRVYDLDDVRAAHAYVDTGRKRGTVLLRLA